jgi:glycine cleavage system aminomethyltransferase T/glycine/D-amino acid oxidase-like deaminating enzyme
MPSEELVMGSVPRVVVIGAGIVGCSLADELTGRGWTDVTVLDQGPLPLTGGSSSHAPGLVFQTNSSPTMSAFARYTVAKFGPLEHEGRPCLLPLGSLEVATTPERVEELHRRQGFAASWGIPAEVVTPERCLQLHPLLDRAAVLAGLHVPSDGLARAVGAGAAQSDRARARGAVFLGGQRVTGIQEGGGRVRAVVTGTGTFPADLVVCCAGFWGPVLGDAVGVRVPLLPLAHQYVHTSPVAGLPLRAGTEAVLPILRHQDRRLYYREHGDHLGIGSYDHRPIPVDPRSVSDSATVTAEQMPSSLPFTPEDFTAAWTASRHLLPALRTASVASGFNGIFSFTPDGAPLVGESEQVAGLWTAEAVWVTHSAGVARAVAEQLMTGHSSVDLRECDLHRFDEVELDPQTVAARSARSFVEVYDVVHPLEPRQAPRDLRSSPFRPRQDALGAVFLDRSGWERPHWYAANAALLGQLPAAWQPPEREAWSARWWSPAVAVEAWRTREAVAMYDMTPLRRVEVTGAGALALLQRLATGDLAKPVGSVTYTLLLDEAGGVRSDVTVARLGEQRFQVGLNTRGDEVWLRRHAPADVAVRDVTGATCCIGLWGPRARDVLGALTADDVSDAGLRYFRAARLGVAGVPVTALRLSYVGELGFELYTGADTGLRLWDALWAAGAPHGVVAAGRAALEALRLEKGYRAWGTDMSTEDSPAEAGLGWAVSRRKSGFTGEAALAARSEAPVRRLTCLTLDDPSHVVMGKEPVWVDGAVAGHVTSAAYGPTIGRTVAYAWLPAGLTPGDPVEVQYFRDRLPATVATEPLVDPGTTRVRG